MSVLARELVASGDVYNSGYGLFPSEQARKDWQNARKKLSRAKLKKPALKETKIKKRTTIGLETKRIKNVHAHEQKSNRK